MFELEPILRDFEQLCGCRLTLHDHHHLLVNRDGTLMVGESRSSHRRTFPACNRANRQYCVAHCMFEYNHVVEARRPRCRINHCREGHIEVAVPVFRNGRHVLSLFAGLWHAPVPKEERPRIVSLCRLLPVFAEGLLAEAERRRAAGPESAALQETIRAFISDNFNRAVSTPDLAKHLALSVARTCHVVRETCGAPFSELLTRERLAHAELFLRHTDYRIGEIAGMCGFASVEHFTRMFRRRNGMSPGEFRRSVRRG